MKKENKIELSKNNIATGIQILSVVALGYGVLNTMGIDTPTITQQIMVGIRNINYLLWAILFQIVALNFKKR